MRMLGRLAAFFLLVFSAHYALLALNPGVTENRISRASKTDRPSVDALTIAERR